MKKILITLLPLVLLLMLITSCKTVATEAEVEVIAEIEEIEPEPEAVVTEEDLSDNANSDFEEVVEATASSSASTSSSKDELTLEEIETAPEVPITNDMYVVGTPFDWSATEAGQMTTDAKREDFSLILNITEDDYAEWALDLNGEPCAVIKVLNNINDSWYGISDEDFEATSWILTTEDSDSLFLKAGQYKITYNATEDKALVSVI